MRGSGPWIGGSPLRRSSRHYRVSETPHARKRGKESQAVTGVEQARSCPFVTMYELRVPTPGTVGTESWEGLTGLVHRVDLPTSGHSSVGGRHAVVRPDRAAFEGTVSAVACRPVPGGGSRQSLSLCWVCQNRPWRAGELREPVAASAGNVMRLPEPASLPLHLPQHPGQHRPKRPILAVDRRGSLPSSRMSVPLRDTCVDSHDRSAQC